MTSGRDEYLERTKRHIDYDKENDHRVWWLNKTGGTAHEGLTVRDYFAAKALGLCGYGVESAEGIAIKAYRIADAMLEMRKRESIDEGENIRELQLSVRAENVLKSEGIETIQELTERSKYDLLKLPNCGPNTVREIITQLHRKGVTLRGLR